MFVGEQPGDQERPGGQAVRRAARTPLRRGASRRGDRPQPTAYVTNARQALQVAGARQAPHPPEAELVGDRRRAGRGSRPSSRSSSRACSSVSARRPRRRCSAASSASRSSAASSSNPSLRRRRSRRPMHPLVDPPRGIRPSERQSFAARFKVGDLPRRRGRCSRPPEVSSAAPRAPSSLAGRAGRGPRLRILGVVVRPVPGRHAAACVRTTRAARRRCRPPIPSPSNTRFHLQPPTSARRDVQFHGASRPRFAKVASCAPRGLPRRLRAVLPGRLLDPGHAPHRGCSRRRATASPLAWFLETRLLLGLEQWMVVERIGVSCSGREASMSSSFAFRFFQLEVDPGSFWRTSTAFQRSWRAPGSGAGAGAGIAALRAPVHGNCRNHSPGLGLAITVRSRL